jgi:hypothetical protein
MMQPESFVLWVNVGKEATKRKAAWLYCGQQPESEL